MSNKPFDRNILNVRERPLSSDINQIQSEYDLTLREVLRYIYLARTSIVDDRPALPFSGFIGSGCKARAQSPVGLQVVVSAGLGFYYDPVLATTIGGVSNLDDLSVYKPLPLNSAVTLAVPAPDPSLPRYDIIEVRPNRRTLDSTSRDVLNPVTGQFDSTSVFKTLGWDLESSTGSVTAPASSTAAVSYKAGIPNAVPAEPAVTPGYVQIARIYVAAGVASVDELVIKDVRRLLRPMNQGYVAAVVSMPTSVTLQPTLSFISAPPGVQIVAVATAFANADCYLYIFCGEPGATSMAIPSVCSGTTTTSEVIATPELFTIDAPAQTALNGATASTATKVAVGQKCYRIRLWSQTPPNPQVYNVTAMFNGGI